jgi:hypothetical protein
VGLFDPQDVVMEQQNKKGSTNKIFDIDGKTADAEATGKWSQVENLLDKK